MCIRDSNKPLGTFELTGIAPAPRGIPKIEVTFDIDANGIVHVSAKDMGTGKEQSMTISGGSALPKDEIERMVREAEAHAEEDKKRVEEIEVRNTAEQLVYSTEKFLADSGDKVPAAEKSETCLLYTSQSTDSLGRPVWVRRARPSPSALPLPGLWRPGSTLDDRVVRPAPRRQRRRRSGLSLIHI